MKLDGVWDFSFDKNATVESFSPQNAVYDEIAAVPGCFDSTPIHLDQRGRGAYRRFVNCGGMVELVLDGIGLFGKVWFDNREIGICEIPFCREVFRFDAGQDGRHELVIAVHNMFDQSENSPFREFFDFYGYGGIYRSVSLRPLPECRIEHLQILPVNPAAGSVDVLIELGGKLAQTEPLTLQFDDNQEFSVSASAGRYAARLAVPSPHLWNTDDPHLHSLSVKTRSETRKDSFGLRIVEAKDGRLLLNGKIFSWIGVNRHDSHPQFGYAMPESLVLSDLLEIKRRGFHCIRGCHYPQSDTVLHLCDRLGILVWNESLGWQNPPESLLSPEFHRKTLRQTEIMVRHAINHPSVVLWGFLNETYTDLPIARPLFSSLIDRIHHLDPSRPVTFASMMKNRDVCMDLPDVISFNIYPGWYSSENNALQEEFNPADIAACFQKLVDFTSTPELRNKPVLISEIGAEALPGLHNLRRWSEEYQSLLINETLRQTINSPRFSGVFLWMFADSRTYSNIKGQERPRGFNNKGLVDEFRRPKLAWLSASKLLTP